MRISNKKDTQLIVENWRKFISDENFVNEIDETETIAEGMLQKGATALGMVAALLGQFANTPSADAMPPEEIARELDQAVNKYDSPHTGVYSVSVDKNNNVVAANNLSGESDIILSGVECENISPKEFRRALRHLQAHDDPKGFDKASDKLKAAARSPVEDVKQQTDRDVRSIPERIKSISKSDKKKLIRDFQGKESDYNFEAAQLRVAAERMFENIEIQKEYGTVENYYIYLIMKQYAKYRKYLPSK